MTVKIIEGDCLQELKRLEPCSVDAIVTDPPYELGFMNKKWDQARIAFDPDTWRPVLRVLKPGGHLVAFGAPRNYHRLACAIEGAGFEIRDSLMWVFGSGFPKSKNLDGEWDGWGTALKPAHEPIILARKPLSESTVAANVLRWGTGALNIDATRIPGGKDYADKCASVIGLKSNRNGNVYGEYGRERGDSFSPSGRWPANICHDGSDEVLALFPYTKSGSIAPHHKRTTSKTKNAYGKRAALPEQTFGDEGSAARFFYQAKANATDRADSKHPTVKPVALMRWLVRLVTPPGGIVLDPFAGTGTTGQAAVEEAFHVILIEQESEYIADIKRRLAGEL